MALSAPKQGRVRMTSAQLKPGQGPLEFSRRLWLRTLFAITILVLYTPIFVLIAFSFNKQNRGGVWKGFTFENYPKAWNNSAIFDAMINSLTIAFVTTLVATVIGTMVAVMLWRFKFPLKPGYEAVMGLPIVIPEICMGVALLLFFNKSGMTQLLANAIWPFNLLTIIIAHIAFCSPFVTIVVRSRLVGFNRQLEEASKDLGATEIQTFWKILVPFMKPGLIAGALLAFTLSLDDFVITFFTAGPETVTFPVKIYSMVKTGVKYEVNAASTVLIIITILATVLAMKLQSTDKAN
jgi:spermidine/putrescine transport system permease protein